MESVIHVAIGLGGWKVDPSDPWRAPYSPADAASAAAEYCGVTLSDEQLAAIAGAVRRAHDADTRNPEDYRGDGNPGGAA